MRTGLVQAAVGVAAVAGLGWVGFTWSFRTKFRPVQDAIRRMNRAVINPRQLRMAGQPGASASVVHHTGRTTGASHRTPVVVVPDGAHRFVIALPYGPRVDWVRNVLAAGTATITHEGRVIAVAEPELVSMDELVSLFPPSEQRTQRLYGVDETLVLHAAAEPGK